MQMQLKELLHSFIAPLPQVLNYIPVQNLNGWISVLLSKELMSLVCTAWEQVSRNAWLRTHACV